MLVLLAAILGLAVGSFLNVVIIRLRAGETLVGRSRCRSCLRQLRWYHNVPIVSFVILKGRCAYCSAKLSWQYPLVELAGGVLYGIGVVVLPAQDVLGLVGFAVTAAFALALFVYDVRFGELPDQLTLPGIAAVAVLNLARGQPALNLVLAGGVGAAFFGLQYLVSRGRWIGSGDIRLGALLGVALGWPLLAVAVVLAYWAGALVGVSLVVVGRKHMQDQLPFGVFLTAAMLVTWLWGNGLLGWYLARLGL